MTTNQRIYSITNKSLQYSDDSSKSASNADLRHENLGQVLTSDVVAELMVDLLVERLEGNLILDPCIGENIFFETLERKERETGKSFTKVGVEVDSRIPPRDWFSQRNDRKLYLQNFFDFTPSEKFDGIIMNPPYVRQEDLANSVVNSKQRIIRALERNYLHYIEKKQNLYVYFFMKAHEVLKDYGKLVAICYDSWLYTRFGKLFKRFLDENFQIQKIIHFEESAFVNADVGATVLQVSKLPLNSKQERRHAFKYVKFKEPEDYKKKDVVPVTEACTLADLSIMDEELFRFPKNTFIRLSDLTRGEIRRGLSPRANKFFLFDEPKFKETVPIIKEVKRINGFIVLPTALKYIIKADGTTVSRKLQTYLDDVRVKITRTGRYNSKRKIGPDERWHEIRFVQPGNFIINYYMRKNVKFIYNPKNYYASDNFYIFDINIDPLLAIALLNSIITKIGVLKNSRTQGKGLRKIQLYEFREVPILNPAVLETEKTNELKKLGSRLISAEESNYDEVLCEIDQIVLDVYNKTVNTNVSLREVHEFFRKKMGKRS